MFKLSHFPPTIASASPLPALPYPLIPSSFHLQVHPPTFVPLPSSFPLSLLFSSAYPHSPAYLVLYFTSSMPLCSHIAPPSSSSIPLRSHLVPSHLPSSLGFNRNETNRAYMDNDDACILDVWFGW